MPPPSPDQLEPFHFAMWFSEPEVAPTRRARGTAAVVMNGENGDDCR